MSKTPPVKYNHQSVQKVSNPPPALNPAKNAPNLRQVTALPEAVSNHPQNNMIVAYKDLNQDVDSHLKRQRQQMFFAFSFFLLLGAFILIAQLIAKPRMVASSEIGFKVEATPSQVEHYQYDKSCYKGENGEQVCLTRTSQKK